METFILLNHLWVPPLNSFYVILELTMMDYAFFLEIDSYLQACNEKKGKYNTLLLVKASLEPNAPLIVTGLKEGVPPLGGQFIAATPLQICYI